MKIYLVRHGEVKNPKKIIYGYLPLPLSKKGEAQSKKAGRFLKDKNISFIFSSPQKRTQQTAKIISQVISKGKIKVKTEKDLRETGFGAFMKGMTAFAAAKKYPKIWRLYWHEPAKVKTGESFVKLADRMLGVIEKYIGKYPGKNLIFVSHRDPISAVLLKLSKRSFNDLHRAKAICDTGSICELAVIGKKIINRTYLAP